MITEYEDYCSYEVAKLLKERGFDGLCACCYQDGNLKTLWDNTFGEVEPQDWNNLSQEEYDYIGLSAWFGCISAPTHQKAKKWLREKNIIIVIQPEYFGVGSKCSAWGCDIWADDNYEKLQGDFPTYEEATEAAIKYCLENLI